MTAEKRYFGKTRHGKDVDSYTLSDGGMSVEILTMGGIIRSISLPTENGMRDIAPGFDDVAGYEGQKAFMGALIGRVANRISGAEFTLGGKKYKVENNDGDYCLHGGSNALDKQIWDAGVEQGSLVLKVNSPDMDGGFPGNLDVEVRYTLKDSELTIEYKAHCDADTPLSMTNHCYFNLGGHDYGCINDHKIQIFSDSITPCDGTLIPTGETMDVTGTPFDFRQAKTIGEGINGAHPQITLGGGYDHNFVLSREPHNTLAPAAVLEFGGIKMTTLTTKPGIQLYSGNFLAGERGKGGAVYSKRSSLCLETQYWPNAVNIPDFPDSILRKGGFYHHVTVYRFENCHIS